MKTANDNEFISEYNSRMVNYLIECLEEGHIDQGVYHKAIKFWNCFRSLYDYDLDCAPCANGILMALDDGCNYCEFELVDGEWEFFYRDRSDGELFDCDLNESNLALSIGSVDKYINRHRG